MYIADNEGVCKYFTCKLACFAGRTLMRTTFPFIMWSRQRERDTATIPFIRNFGVGWIVKLTENGGVLDTLFQHPDYSIFGDKKQ